MINNQIETNKKKIKGRKNHDNNQIERSYCCTHVLICRYALKVPPLGKRKTKGNCLLPYKHLSKYLLTYVNLSKRVKYNSGVTTEFSKAMKSLYKATSF